MRYIIVAVSLAFTAGLTGTAATVYVAPNGNDANPGTAERPLATAVGARDAMRKLRAGGTNRTEVVFADGVYVFAKPLELDARDAHVVWRAARKGGAVWSGARCVDAWSPVEDPAVRALLPAAARDHVRVGVVPGTDPLPGFRGGGCGTPGHLQEIPISLFQGTNRLALACWPNPGEGDGYARAGEPLGPMEKRHDARYSTGGEFRFKSSRLAAWAKEPELWAYGLWCYEWADAKTRVESVDCAKQTLRIDMGPLGFGLRQGCAFQIINAFSELDRPGEWVIDRARRRVYVWPLKEPRSAAERRPYRGATSPEDDAPRLAVAEGLVRAKGIDGGRFEGLVFEEVRGTALVIRESKRAYVRCCEVRRTSSWGVRIDGGSDCRVEGCDLHDLGEGGISLAGGDFRKLLPARHLADNNHIHHYGNVVPNYRPGVALNGVGCACTHNLIHHTRHQAIAFSGNDHRIAFNVAHDTCTYNDDAGTVYCCTRDWSQRGTVIEHNLLHMAGKQPKCTHTDAVYLDDYSSGVIVRNNLINRASLGVHMGGGQDCLVTGNVIVNCSHGIHLGSRGLDSFAKSIPQKGRASGMFQRLERDKALFESPLWRGRYPNLLRVYDFDDASFAHNALFNVITNNVLAGCGGIDKSNWKKIAPYSTVTNNLEVTGDPGFEDYANFVWELKEGPARQLVGNLRVAEMGLYPSAARFSPAVKFGSDVTRPRPIHVEYAPASVRIDIVHPGKLPAGETAWADAVAGCEVPVWGRGVYVMASFGTALNTWQTYTCAFTPRFDCMVQLTTMGARGEKTLYDDFRVEGAELKNPGFEAAEGWYVPVANPQDYRAPICNITRPYGILTAQEAGCAPAEGTQMACGSDMLSFIQRIQVKKGVPVRISFKARALPLR